MPEGYTHVRTARAAATAADMVQKVFPAAFCAGANGPDEFFCYQIWRPADKRDYDLPELGSRMHSEKTGQFLMSLVDHAKTIVQQSYALGFISHYVTDYTCHPYVEMICHNGQLYDMPNGHGHFEIALDSELHYQDYGTRAVAAAHSNPRLTGTALVQVAQLLQVCLQEVYGLHISLEALGDTFHHSYFLRSCFVSRFGVKKALFKAVEPMFGGEGFITAHVSPALLRGGKKGESSLDNLPRVWEHPTTHQTCEISIQELLDESVRKSITGFLTTRSYWKGRTPREELVKLLGSRSYETGVEDAVSRGEAPWQPPKKHED